MLWYRLSSYHIGEELKLTVKRLRRTPQLILLSEKAAHKVINEAKKKELFERLDVGSKVEGKVWRIYDSGVLLDLDSTLGFIPKEELFQDNKFRVHRGQKLEALVTKIDKKAYKITLSLKRLDEVELWEKVKFYPGEIKEGVIVRIKKNIYFIRLPCGIEGVAYEEDIKKEGVVTKELKENDKVKVRILNFSKEKKQLKLTILPEFTSSPQKITLGDIFKEKFSRLVS
jgi:ribosomal protein S1